METAAALDAEQIKALLGLAPHPTCGFTSVSYTSGRAIPAGALPDGYDGERSYASVLYFLVTPDASMALHRIRSDQMYHHYLGDPLEVLLLTPGGRADVVTVGPDLEAGMRPQLLIPGGTWHVSRVVPGGRYALLGTTEWPGFDPADLELGDPALLAADFPGAAEQISAFAP